VTGGLTQSLHLSCTQDVLLSGIYGDTHTSNLDSVQYVSTLLVQLTGNVYVNVPLCVAQVLVISLESALVIVGIIYQLKVLA
jgi:hypothetical protein